MNCIFGLSEGDYRNSDERKIFDCFLKYVFVTSVPVMIVGHLWPLAYLPVSTVLQDIDDMITFSG